MAGLAYEVVGGREPRGPGAAGPPLVLLHGFTQTRGSWGRLLPLLSVHRPLILVDLPGHGESSAVRADLWESAAMVAGVIGETRPSGTVDLLGYSLGARVALHAALLDTAPVGRLVLVSGTAGMADDDARLRRRRRDAALAAELEAGGDLEGFLRRWLAAPMFASLRGDASQMDSRLANTPRGLAASLRLAGTGSQEPLWDRLASLGPPVLAVAGATDPRFVALARRVTEAVPAGLLSVVPGAGHAVHLEQPALTARIVDGWLRSSTARTSDAA